MSSINKLLPKNQIQVIETAENWIKAVEIANNPLLKNKMITHTYLENMIRSVEENGPYMVLAHYFALMHAKPGLGVNKRAKYESFSRKRCCRYERETNPYFFWF